MIADLELADYLLIVERVLGLPAEVSPTSIASDWPNPRWPRRRPASATWKPTPTLRRRPPSLCWHLVKNHPLPDGNKRCAFLATVEFVERNRRTWVPAPGDRDETDRVIRAVASGDLSEADFRDWIVERCG